MSELMEILFVDDESHILSGLRRMLRTMRNEWNMHFVDSGEAAIAHFESHRVDVIVTDMRMPGINGADLLAWVQENFPETVRLVLSGHADKEMIMKMMGCAHQFLAKPCDAEVLRATIERCSRANQGAQDERIQAIISRFNDVPSIPANYDELVGRIRDPESLIEQIADIVSRDPSISAHILKLVNSAFFGFPRRIADIAEAVNLMGLDTLRTLVLSAHVFKHFGKTECAYFSFEKLRDHSLRTATGARAIAESESVDGPMVGEAFAAGMLHDIGRLAMAHNFPEEYDSILTTLEADACALCEAESQILNMQHTEVGSALLAFWGLPAALIDAAAWHHQPSQSGQSGLCPLTFVHVASAWSSTPDADSDDTRNLDMAFFEASDLVDRIPEWKRAFDEAIAA